MSLTEEGDTTLLIKKVMKDRLIAGAVRKGYPEWSQYARALLDRALVDDEEGPLDRTK